MSNRYQSSCPLDCKVYVGGLTRHASREEIEDAFGRYGKLRNVFVARNPPGFAFVEYDDPQDAEDSVRALDGRYELKQIIFEESNFEKLTIFRMICGTRVRVEISHGKTKSKGPYKRSSERSDMRNRGRSR